MIPFKIKRKIEPLQKKEIEKLVKNAEFGKIFTDHMAFIKYDSEKGWFDPEIIPFQNFQINPANATFHYAQEIFEGLKAYRGSKGEVLLFRPEQNAQRFQNSAYRLSMPILPESLFLGAIENLLRVDQEWLLEKKDYSLYLRPFMISAENFLGIRSSKSYYFCVIASPAFHYFKENQDGLTVWVEDVYSRCGPGGTGSVKCGGNYAASLIAYEKARKNNCDQVLFLDSVEHKWIEELSGMNIFFITNKNHFITPLLNGNILPGITRDSILQLAQFFHYPVEEKLYSFSELKKDIASGKIVEAFACGTAASIVPIKKFKYLDSEIEIKNKNQHSLTQEMLKILTNIQTGHRADFHQFVRVVSE